MHAIPSYDFVFKLCMSFLTMSVSVHPPSLMPCEKSWNFLCDIISWHFFSEIERGLNEKEIKEVCRQLFEVNFLPVKSIISLIFIEFINIIAILLGVYSLLFCRV